MKEEKEKPIEILSRALGADKVRRDPSQRGADAAVLPPELFTQAAKALKAQDFRLVAEWASDETASGRGFSVFAAYNRDRDYLIVKIELPPSVTSFPSLAKKYASSIRFERQIKSLMGLTPQGNPDPRPWIKHEDWPEDAYPLRKSFDPSTKLPRVKGSYAFVRAEGEGVYEIPVGPVHAGIIEPGHFRFQAVGEDVLNLEEKLGYVHKGIEKRFEALPWKEAHRLAGRVSGDTTVAHATAYSRAIEGISGFTPPPRALWMRALLLERERIANHINDIGFIANDAAFAFMHYQMAILREKVLRTNRRLFGHRLLMDLVLPGGVMAELDPGGAKTIVSEMEEVSGEFERLVRIYEDNASLSDRVHGTGVLTPDAAKDLGAVGFVARASGQALDSRLQDPYPPYDTLVPQITILTSGDVHARTWVRIEETRESMRLVSEMAANLPEGASYTDCPTPPSGMAGFATVEGWRGEIVYWVQIDPAGSIGRCMVRDPSSVNWIALEQALKGNIVPEFPLCNKSFNQSYSGHDL